MEERHSPSRYGYRHQEMMELFTELTFREKWKRVARGLRQPLDTGDHKYARLQLLRLLAPVAAVLVPIAAVGALIAFAAMAPAPVTVVEVQIVEPEELPELDEIEDLDNEPLEPPEPIEMDFSESISISDQDSQVVAPGPATDFSPQPQQFDAVAITKSPIIMKGIYGSRSPGARGGAMAAYGGSGKTEGAVIRALRWLQSQQSPEGSWPNSKHAMTGLALLTFLAHGETPASEEFGPTVEKAIRWLISTQGADGGFPRRYQHAIATYALCEAYALTKVPMIRDAAEKAVDIIIKGQNETGGWCYNLKPPEDDDTSVMGWCAQALKAAKMAGIEHPDLDSAIRLAIKGFQKNASPAGGFGYRTPGATGLTGVGTLCMQLLGAANESECRAGLAVLEDAVFNWEPGGKFNKSYYWYYITQAKFHAGGKVWKEWNSRFAPVLVKNQTVLEGAGVDGKDIGFWDMPEALSGHTDGPVMNTALSALQLQVYYRYLPTYKAKAVEALEEPDFSTEDGDIEIDISNITI